MKELKWPAVVVIVAVLVVMGWLADRSKDVTAVLAGIIAVLSALGYGYLQTKQSEIQQSTAKIEENTNGRIGQLTALAEKQQADQQAMHDNYARLMRDMTDQYRRDMKDMADKLATMTPPPIPTSGVPAYTPEEDHSPHL